MNIPCPSCNNTIARDDISVIKDTALCRTCGRADTFSSIVANTKPRTASRSWLEPRQRPWGTWVTVDGSRLRIGARNVTWAAPFLILFAIFWTTFACGGCLTLLLAAPQAWPMFPFAAMFFAAGCLLCFSVIVSVMGRVEVTIDGDHGEVISGVGPFLRRRSFIPSEVERITERPSALSTNRSPMIGISLDGPRCVFFGSFLPHPRRYFLGRALAEILACPHM